MDLNVTEWWVVWYIDLPGGYGAFFNPTDQPVDADGACAGIAPGFDGEEEEGDGEAEDKGVVGAARCSVGLTGAAAAAAAADAAGTAVAGDAAAASGGGRARAVADRRGKAAYSSTSKSSNTHASIGATATAAAAADIAEAMISDAAWVATASEAKAMLCVFPLVWRGGGRGERGESGGALVV